MGHIMYFMAFREPGVKIYWKQVKVLDFLGYEAGMDQIISSAGMREGFRLGQVII